MKKNYEFDWSAAADPAMDSGNYLLGVVSAEVDESVIASYLREALVKILSDAFNPDVAKCNSTSILNTYIQMASELVGEPITRRDALMAFAGFKAGLCEHTLEKIFTASLNKK